MGVVFHQWSFMGAVFDQSGFSSVVFHQSGLSSEWSLVRVVFHQSGLLSELSFIRVVFGPSCLSSEWSLVRVVFHQSGLWSVIFSSVVFGQSRLFIRVSDHGSVIFSSESSLVRVAFLSGCLTMGPPVCRPVLAV